MGESFRAYIVDSHQGWGEGFAVHGAYPTAEDAAAKVRELLASRRDLFIAVISQDGHEIVRMANFDDDFHDSPEDADRENAEAFEKLMSFDRRSEGRG